MPGHCFPGVCFIAFCYILAMRIITRTRLIEFWQAHPPAEGPLSAWERAVKSAEWINFATVKKTFNSADVVGRYVVFNVNSSRIVAAIHYDGGRVYIRHVLTHGEYEKWSRSGADQ